MGFSSINGIVVAGDIHMAAIAATIAKIVAKNPTFTCW
jgi:hypothetical protein